MSRIIPVHRAESERTSVVRAPCSDAERGLFHKLQASFGGSISDLIRYAVARLAIEEGKGKHIPETWMIHYPEAREQQQLAKLAKELPPPATRALPKEVSSLRIGPRLSNEPDYRPDE